MSIDPTLQDDREKAISRHIEAVNEGDAEGAADAFGYPRIELIGLNRVHDGRDEVIRHLKERQRAFPTQHLELIALHHSDETAVAEFWFTGRPAGEISGIPASGRSFRCRMASIFIFEGASIVSQRVYFDVGTIARQLA